MANNVRLVMVSIGKPEVGKSLVQHLGVSNGEDFVYADMDNALYDSLDLNRSLVNFINPATAFSFRDRIFENRMGDIIEVLSKWKDAIYLPPKGDQAFLQGGAFVLNHVQRNTVLAHYDVSTGAHIDMDYVTSLAMKEAASVSASSSTK